MAYGTVKVDNITFTNGGSDQTITVSGIVQSISGNITATGTLQGATIIGTSTVSGATVTGNVGNFTAINGGTVTLTSGVIASGTAANPSLSIVGDSNTGLYSPGADQLAISTAGTGRLFVDASGQARVGPESDTDRTSHKIQLSASDENVLSLQQPANTVGAKSSLGFWGRNSNNAAVAYGKINTELKQNNAGNHAGDLVLSTAGSGSLGERARISSAGVFTLGNGTPAVSLDPGTTSRPLVRDSSGRIGVGTSTPTSPLHLGGTPAGQEIRISTNTNAGYIGAIGNLTQIAANRNPVNGSIVNTGCASAFINLEAEAGDGNIQFATTATNNSGPTERMRIDNSGRVLINSSTTPNGATFLVKGGPGGTNAAHLQLTSATSPYGGGRISVTNVGGGLEFYTHTGAVGSETYTERMRIHAAGNTSLSGGISVGGLGNPGTAIVFNGAVIGAGAGTYPLKWNSSTGVVTYDTSSALLKENIIDCPYGIEEVKQLQPRKYLRIDDQREEIGFVADEVIQVMPEYVPVGPKSVITKNEDDTEEIPLGVHYDKLTAVLTKALQEAIAKIETLEARLTAAGI